MKFLLATLVLVLSTSTSFVAAQQPKEDTTATTKHHRHLGGTRPTNYYRSANYNTGGRPQQGGGGFVGLDGPGHTDSDDGRLFGAPNSNVPPQQGYDYYEPPKQDGYAGPAPGYGSAVGSGPRPQQQQGTPNRIFSGANSVPPMQMPLPPPQEQPPSHGDSYGYDDPTGTESGDDPMDYYYDNNNNKPPVHTSMPSSHSHGGGHYSGHSHSYTTSTTHSHGNPIVYKDPEPQQIIYQPQEPIVYQEKPVVYEEPIIYRQQQPRPVYRPPPQGPLKPVFPQQQGPPPLRAAPAYYSKPVDPYYVSVPPPQFVAAPPVYRNSFVYGYGGGCSKSKGYCGGKMGRSRRRA